MDNLNTIQYQPLHLAIQDDFFVELARQKKEVYGLESKRIEIVGVITPSHVSSMFPTLSLTSASFNSTIATTIGQYEMPMKGLLTIYNSHHEYDDCIKEINKEADEIIDCIISSSHAPPPLFFLHVFADLKSNQFDFNSHFPCFSPCPSLQFESNMILESADNMIEDESRRSMVEEAVDYGQKIYPTTLLQNHITHRFYSEYKELQKDLNILLPHTTLYTLILKQQRHVTIRQITIPITFSQLESIPLYIYNNGIAAGCCRGHRSVELQSNSKVAQSEAMRFNIQLMKWRLFPNLDEYLLANSQILLIGAGTLGCAVARSLIGWNIHHITFLDGGMVSPSNPTRQCLYSWKHAIQSYSTEGTNAQPLSHKAEIAASALKAINPSIESHGIVATVPMPDHVILGASSQDAVEQSMKESIKQMSDLIDAHDVIFLMTDSRESRWLPSLLCCLSHTLCINIALGGDSLLIQRYGLDMDEYNKYGLKRQNNSLHEIMTARTSSEDIEVEELQHGKDGCYFCNDIMGPSNTLTDRALDQMCTTTRIGLSYIASGLAVELLINYLHNAKGSGLGSVPNQMRMNLSDFNIVKYESPFYTKCSCCGNSIQACCKAGGVDYLMKCIFDSSIIRKTSGLNSIADVAENLADMEVE